MIEIPKFKASFTGTGDLFSALFLAWISKTNDIGAALENTVSTIYAVISRTLKFYEGNENKHKLGSIFWEIPYVIFYDFVFNPTDSGDNNDPKLLELKLIQSKSDIENPNVLFKSKII